MIDTGTICTIVPSEPTTKCEQTLGSSCSSGSATSGAKVPKTALVDPATEMCSTITFGSLRRQVSMP